MTADEIILVFHKPESRKFTEESDRLNSYTPWDRENGEGGVGAIA